MKLYNRPDYSKIKFEKYFQKNEEEPDFYTDRYCGYSLTFVRKLHEYPRDYPKISVKTIKLPENVSRYNTGCSLEKWSKKKPRLQSANKKGCYTNVEVLDENAYDINEILENLEHSDDIKEGSNISEANSDIEELWQRSKSNIENYTEEDQKGGYKKHDKFCKKMLKHKLKKCIKFSISKPPSPQTEQIIRVDISSTISLNELKELEEGKGGGKNSRKSAGRKQKMDFKCDNQNFVVCCSQLAIEPKQR